MFASAFSVITSIFSGSKIMGFFKSKKLWVTLLIIAGGLGVWYMQDTITDLSAEVATAEERIEQVKQSNKSLEKTIDEINARVERMRAAQERISQVRSELNEQLEQVRQQVENIDIDKNLQNNPQETLKRMKHTFNEQIECIESATGNKEAECDSLKQSSSQQ